MMPILIEEHDSDGVNWIVSFNGPNPNDGDCVVCANRHEAEKLIRILNEQTL